MDSLNEDIIIKRNLIQDDIVEQVLDYYQVGDSCTVESATGTGKTFILFKLLYKLFPNRTSKPQVLLLAEQRTRLGDFHQSAEVYKSITGDSPFDDFDIEFGCYQGYCKKQNKKEYDFKCLDEIHDGLTPKYYLSIIFNKSTFTLGLTATPNERLKVSGIPGIRNKGDLYNKYAPIIVRYTLDKARTDETMRKFVLFEIEHELDDKLTCGIKIKGLAGRQTEKSLYSNVTKILDDMEFPTPRNKMGYRKYLHIERSRIFYNIDSKMREAYSLIRNINKAAPSAKTLIFANSVPILDKLTPFIISSHKPKQVEQYKQWFRDGKIKTVGSFKILQQGANLGKIDNLIIHSYESNPGKLVQRLGRLRLDNSLAFVFIFKTKDTVEEKWYNNIIEELKIESSDIIKCENVNDALTEYAKIISLQN